MRSVMISARCSLLLCVACGSVAQDPDAAARAARSAAGALSESLHTKTQEPSGPQLGEHDDHERPEGVGKSSLPPAKGTATCILSSGSGSGSDDISDVAPTVVTMKRRSEDYYAALCDERMDDASCRDLCGARDWAWNSSKGVHGTCHETKTVRSGPNKGTRTLVWCGCWCER